MCLQLRDFRRNGLTLPPDKREEVKAIKKKISVR
jgi:Zn-dependent oligopeptidase